MASAQTLSKEEAVSRALENNFNIAIAKNNAEQTLNDLSKNNTGNKPTLALSGGLNYNLDNTTANFQDGRQTSLTFAGSYGANAALNAGYVIFDGFFRKYNIKQLESQHELSEIAIKAAMQDIAAQTLSQYYQVASLNQNLALLEESILVSKRRMELAKSKLEFGQANGLSVLNAQVDLNNDSLAFYNLEIQINNAKRMLNSLMLDQKTLDYEVDADAEFIKALSKETLKEKMLNENLALSQMERSMQIGANAMDLVNTAKKPTVRVDLGYGFNYNNNNPASFLSSISNNGLRASATVAWNILDGGRNKYLLEQTRISNVGLVLQKDQLIENLKLQFDMAWANYQDRLFIYANQKKNIEISRANFTRTEEQFKFGQLTSVDFRQAQLNLLNAELALNNAAYQVKIAEVELLYLSGGILN